VMEAVGEARGVSQRRGHCRCVGRRISARQRRQGSRLGFPGMSGAAAAGELRRPPDVEGWGGGGPVVGWR
jgi:hypothetical protein